MTDGRLASRGRWLIRCLALGLICVLVTASPLSAAELGVVVLDHGMPAPPGQAWPEAEQRTRAELEAVGLSVRDADSSKLASSSPANELASAARRHSAVAAVKLIRYSKPPGVDIWVVDEVTGKTSLRHLAIGHLPASEAVAVVAFAVVELLNASLLELRAAHPRRGPLAPSPAVFRLVDDNLEIPLTSYRTAVRVGAAAIGSPGGLGVLVGPTLGAGFGLHSRWVIEGELLAAATQSRLDGDAGVAHVGLGLGRLLLVHRASAQRIQPMFGIGAGVLFAWVSGDPEERYRATSDTTAVFLPSALGAVAARISSSLRIRLAFGVGFAMPALKASLAGDPSATAGRPLLDGSVGLEWALSEMGEFH
jgi:hypothetical protein